VGYVEVEIVDQRVLIPFARPAHDSKLGRSGKEENRGILLSRSLDSEVGTTSAGQLSGTKEKE
jgi:hypothetical protein